jgi:polygalacturonase
LEFRQRRRHHYYLREPIVIKQLLIYVLALAIIFGSATTKSERARAFLLPGQTSSTVQAMGDEEFVAPFPSWANVQTNYGAVGDGVTDDTAAIQNCLTALGTSTYTCYFPAGIYKSLRR